MSNRQIKTASVTFEPVAEHKPSPPSGWLLLFGVFFPAAVIAIGAVYIVDAGKTAG